MGWVVKVTPRPLFTPGKDPVPIVQEAGWAPGSVWMGAENLAPTGTRSTECPARSQSLYRLSYPALSTKVSLREFFEGRRSHFSPSVTRVFILIKSKKVQENRKHHFHILFSFNSRFVPISF